MKKDKPDDLVTSLIFEDNKNLRQRFKALRSTIKSIKKFTQKGFGGSAEC